MRTVQVSRCLDKKLILFGFEIFDLFAIFVLLSVLNFIFGGSSYKVFFAWVPTGVLALVLYYGKKGKPDKYLIHWLRYQLKPGGFSAFQEPTVVVPPPTIKKGDK